MIIPLKHLIILVIYLFLCIQESEPTPHYIHVRKKTTGRPGITQSQTIPRSSTELSEFKEEYDLLVDGIRNHVEFYEKTVNLYCSFLSSFRLLIGLYVADEESYSTRNSGTRKSNQQLAT